MTNNKPDQGQSAQVNQDCSKINLLYKNLEHVTHVTYSAESSMLGWETIYALIEGQLIIAYFSSISKYNLIGMWNLHVKDLNSFPEFILILFGLVLAISWFILVSLNYKHQTYRSRTIKNLELRLGIEYCKTSALYFCPEDKHIDNFISRRVAKILTSTWFFRKIVPISIIIFWLYSLLGLLGLLPLILIVLWIINSMCERRAGAI